MEIINYYCPTDLCHSFQSFNTCYKDTGLWGIYFVCDPLQCEVRRINDSTENSREKANFT